MLGACPGTVAPDLSSDLALDLALDLVSGLVLGLLRLVVGYSHWAWYLTWSWIWCLIGDLAWHFAWCWTCGLAQCWAWYYVLGIMLGAVLGTCLGFGISTIFNAGFGTEHVTWCGC